MKVLYFEILIVLVLCHGLPLDQPPANIKVQMFRNSQEHFIVVTWDKIDNLNDAEPILGYKVKLFEGKLIVILTKNENDTAVTDVKVDFEGQAKEPIREVAVIEVPANKTDLKYHGLKPNVLYEVAVQAFTANKLGTLSDMYKFAWV